MDAEAPTPDDKPKGKPRGKREQTKAQNRQTILDAGRRVFAELGYGAATVRDIIRATPLASGTFYNYFKSKEEIFQAIRDEAALKIRPRLRAERLRAATAEEFLLANYRIFFDFVAAERTNPTNIPHTDDAQNVRMDSPEVLAGFAELREDIEQAIARGFFPPADPGLLAAAMVGVGFEVAEEMLKRQPQDPAGAASFAAALFLGGIKALPPLVAAAPPPPPAIP